MLTWWVTPGPLVLTGTALLRQFSVERIIARRMRDRCHELHPGVLHQPLDLTLVVPLAGAAKAICEQVMTDQLGERPRPLALAVTQDLRDRDRRVVVEDRLGHPTEERERRHMPVQERLGRLARIRLHEAGVRLRQVHAQKVHLLAHAADDPDRLAKIHLRMSRRVGQRYKRSRPRARHNRT